MKTLLFYLLCLVAVPFLAQAQSVSDADKRSFDDLQEIKIDVEGDGKLDTIEPQTYQVIKRKFLNKPIRKREIQNWIAFDLTTARGNKIKKFFRYNYGTAGQGGSYWVYALRAIGDVNRDGKTDLMFYSGDDTGDERVILANRGNRFVVIRIKKSDSRFLL